MKITICAYDAPNNMDGPTSWLKRLLPFLKDHGIETRILFIAAHSKKLPAFDYFRKQGYSCKLIYWELFNEEKIQAILNDIKEYPPDIFIPNYFPEACHAAKWVKKAGIPTIGILHNDDDFHIELVRSFASKGKEVALSAIVGVSKLITQVITDQNPDEKVVVKCIPYGAPLPSRTTRYNFNEKLKLVYAGRMVEPQKRISEVAKAFCRVAAEVPGTECVLYGSGRSLENVLNILNNQGKGLPVYYGGNIETEKVQEHLLQNHVFVLLSDYEGIPISLMEAMGCGLVPVCTNIRSGMTELIEDGKTGLLVNDRRDAFVAAIKKIKGEDGLWSEISHAARLKIEKEYSGDVCNNKWLEFLFTLGANIKTSSVLEIPNISELKGLFYPVEFNRSSNPMPSFLIANLLRVKVYLGRIKRLILNQTYFI